MTQPTLRSSANPALLLQPRAPAGLSVMDATMVLVGVVIGIGIFGFPPLVAQHAGSEAAYIGLWCAGGLVMLVGALCYAELGSAYPGAGGEYLYLTRAWGRQVGLMFAWARCSVIQTGAIAVVAYIYGDYAQRLAPLGTYGPALHAAIAVAALTALNVAGTRYSKRLQWLFTALTVAALAAVLIASLAAAGDSPLRSAAEPAPLTGNAAGLLGMGMVFVLLTYGGWNEAAYLSGELRNPGRNMSRVLLIGTLLVTGAYVLTNLALLEIFGLQGLRDTPALGADVMQLAAGPYAAALLSLTICATALSTINGTIITGARVYCALGRDVPRLRALAHFGHAKVDGKLMDALPKLEIISNFGVGVDQIDLYAAKQRSIIVTNTPDVLNDCVADTAMALVLNTLRRFPDSENYLRAGVDGKLRHSQPDACSAADQYDGLA